MNTESNIQKELWKEVKDFEGYYEVSNFGRVRRLSRVKLEKNGRKRKIESKILKTKTYGKRYPQKNLTSKHIKKVVNVHRLVAESFIPNPENKREVNHKNGIKTDNRVENLEWVTSSENIQHAYDTNLKKKGEKKWNAKLTKTQVLEIRYLYENKIENQPNLGIIFNVTRSCIQRIVHYDTWKHL